MCGAASLQRLSQVASWKHFVLSDAAAFYLDKSSEANLHSSESVPETVALLLQMS